MNPLRTLARGLVHEARVLRGAFYRRLSISRGEETGVVNEFHKLYYDARSFNMTWRNTFWMGRPVLKCPLDLWIYQEILTELRPAAIVEMGTAYGGSALYLASVCDVLDAGRIITVDVEPRKGLPVHPRITYVTGSSVGDDVVEQIRRAVAGADPVLVILDSDHHKEHVLAELRRYGPMVTRGSYLIVEDTNLNGHPVMPDFGPGPAEAVEDFLASDPGFVVDREKEKLYLTFNPGGYLKKVQ